MTVELNPMIVSHKVQQEAEARPDHRLFTFEDPSGADRTVCYADLWTKANRLAAYYEERGIGMGDKVAILMRNHPEFVYALVASAIGGVQLVPIDPRTKGDKLRYQLRDSGSKMVLCTADLAQAVGEVAAGLPVVCLSPGEGGGDDELGQILETARPTMDQRVESTKHPHQIIYTSGTTGDPKGVVLPLERTFVATVLAQGFFKYLPDHVLYTGLSLTHGNAQMVTCFPAIFLGNHAVISERFTRSRIWDIARAHGVTTFSNLGGIMSGIYNMPPRPDDADNPVQYVISAGTPRAIWQPFMDRFGVEIFEWYAAVEGGFCCKPIGEGPVGSFGRAIPGFMDLRVVREDGSTCESGEVGELISRSSNGEAAEVTYHGNEEASAQKTRGGWLRSGDMVHEDADGWLFFDFRKGGGLRHNGDFVSPDYVERVVGEHPQVAEVFVYGVPASSGAPGEKDVVAAIVPIGSDPLDVASIFERCREGLEANFVPSYLQVVDEIPKTISEKPQERILLLAFSTDADNVHQRIA